MRWHSSRDGDEVKAEGLQRKKLQVSGYLTGIARGNCGQKVRRLNLTCQE